MRSLPLAPPRKVKVKVAQSRLTLRPHGLHRPWNSPGQNIGVGSLSLLQGIFPAQGSNSGLLHCRRILYQLSHKGSPRILEWVTYPFSSRSSRLRNRAGVSCITGRFFTHWAIREALSYSYESSSNAFGFIALKPLLVPLPGMLWNSFVWNSLSSLGELPPTLPTSAQISPPQRSLVYTSDWGAILSQALQSTQFFLLLS